MRVGKWLAVLVVAVLVGALVTPALAGSTGHKNTAVVLGGAALYQLSKGNTAEAAALGLGAAVAYDQYKKDKDSERYGYYYGDGRYGGYYGDRSYRYDRSRTCPMCGHRQYVGSRGYCERCDQMRARGYRVDTCRHCRTRTYVIASTGYCDRCRDYAYRNDRNRRDGNNDRNQYDRNGRNRYERDGRPDRDGRYDRGDRDRDDGRYNRGDRDRRDGRYDRGQTRTGSYPPGWDRGRKNGWNK